MLLTICLKFQFLEQKLVIVSLVITLLKEEKFYFPRKIIES